MTLRLVMTAILLAAAALIGIAVGIKIGHYLADNKNRLDPLELSVSNIAPDKSVYQTAYLGDSRAKHWGDYAAKIDPGILNLGIANQTIAQVRYRIDYQLKDIHFDTIIIQVGINDIKQLPSDPNLYAVHMKTCKENLRYIVDTAQKQSDRVIISTIFPTAETPLWKWPFISTRLLQGIDELNSFLITLQGDRVEIFDAYNLLIGSNGYIKNEFKLDMLHINEQGYAQLNTHLPVH